MDIKSYFSLFFDSEPRDNNTQSNQVHTSQADRKAWVDAHGKELMFDHDR